MKTKKTLLLTLLLVSALVLSACGSTAQPAPAPEAAAPAEAVGQVIYDTARRSLLKTLEGVFA